MLEEIKSAITKLLNTGELYLDAPSAPQLVANQREDTYYVTQVSEEGDIRSYQTKHLMRVSYDIISWFLRKDLT